MTNPDLCIRFKRTAAACTPGYVDTKRSVIKKREVFLKFIPLTAKLSAFAPNLSVAAYTSIRGH